MSSSLTPRLTTSRQWTDLPDDFTSKVAKVFKDEFKAEAARGEFVIEGRIYSQEAVIRIGYLESGRLKQVNFEASMDLPQRTEATEEGGEDTADKAMDRIYACIDALGSVMEEFFEMDEEDEIDIPLRWRAYEFEGETVYLQHSTVNTRLEEEADRILGLAANELVQETAVSEDALANAEIDSELAFEVQKAIRSGKFPGTGGTEPGLN